MRPNRLADPKAGDTWDASIWVDDADAFHAECSAKGATIARGLCDQFYGCREFDEDCNGYRICFGEPLQR
jgi:predicted enzyme related to lactoylglutathione lyase